MEREHLLKGAEREAVASADLMRRGFEVFRAMGNFSCDLLAQKNGHILRVEVKGYKERGYRIPTGPIGCVCSKGGHTANSTRFDILITVVGRDVFYNRSIFHKINAASIELPLREEYSKKTTKKNLERALSMTEKNA